MKRLFFLIVSTSLLVLTGCASTVRSQVTAFNEWPATLPDNSYVFERSKSQDQSLEYRSYESLVRNEVARLGLTEATPGKQPALKILLDYSLSVSDLRVIEPVYADPFFYGGGLYGRGFYGRNYYGFGYDPFWGAPLVAYQDHTFQLNNRQLHVLINRYVDGKSLYDVKVLSRGENPSMSAVMPYMVKSAFADFPGRNGTTRTVDLKMQD